MTDDARETTADAIFHRIADGALTDEACEAESVTARTLRRWCEEDEVLRVRYMRARSIAADALAEESVRIAKGDGARRYADPQERRLAYDALRWLAGKRRPKEYGDRVEHEVSGSVSHLHLDALRAPRATASAKLAPHNGIAALASGDELPTGSIGGVDAESVGEDDEAPPSQ